VSEALGPAVEKSWRLFLETYEPLRPELYRYCRHLTRSPWDAEDMAQDTLARAFVTLGCASELPRSPRAWLFRIASNLWINHRRHVRERPTDDGALPEAIHHEEPRASREAAGTLLSLLSPQERAAVVLKDVFELSLEEVADTLATTPGAIKAALHRGRGKLVASEPTEPAAPMPPVLDAFCAAFDARDLDALTALLLEGATVELPCLRIEHGPAAARAGTFRGTLFGCPDRAEEPPPDVHAEVRAHRGEPLLLWWRDGEVHTIVRADVVGDRIARLRSYYHAPDVLEEICHELGLPHRTHGYRFW
jgi:RNA polymerase sigma-70 factor (ECF subfamily)